MVTQFEEVIAIDSAGDIGEMGIVPLPNPLPQGARGKKENKN